MADVIGTGEVRGHALVVGAARTRSPAIERDVEGMAAMLQRRGFAVDLRTGDRATRAGILTGYDDLIASARPDLAAVVYYSGHGAYARVDSEQAAWQCICPTDLDATTDDDFRGITAWELSIKQALLTRQTRNVTVIFDCCHAAHMSRDAGMLGAEPKALAMPHPVRRGFAHHLRALRARYGAAVDAVHPLGNGDAVRLVACGQHQVAFQSGLSSGEPGSVFTSALLGVLRDTEGAAVSWAALEDEIRQRVQRRFLVQRPEIEGPARRRLFSLDEDAAGNAVSIVATPGGFRIAAGRVMGVAPGDVYGVMPLGSTGYRAAAEIAGVQVGEVVAISADAMLRGWRNGHRELPPGAVAFVVEKAAVRRGVKLDVPAPARAVVEAALAATRTLRVAAPDDDALATLRVDAASLVIEDRQGPLGQAMRYPAELPLVIQQLANLAVAQGLRELEGAHGVGSDEVELELGVVARGALRRLPDHGASLGLLDRIYVKVRARTQRVLYAHVLNLGVQGAIKLLTASAPSGVRLGAGDPELVLGRTAEAVTGLPLGWPSGFPRGAPRTDEAIAIITAAPMSLRGLETGALPDVVRGRGSRLQALMAQLRDGTPCDRRRSWADDGFLVKRLSYVLHPDEIALQPATMFEPSGG